MKGGPNLTNIQRKRFFEYELKKIINRIQEAST
jgi:hypothetical protein